MDGRVHVAGQIPLIPASMTIPPAENSPYPLQCTLALQHVERILEALRSRHSTGGGWTGWCEGGITWWAGDDPDAVQIVREAWKIWNLDVSHRSILVH